MVAMALSAGASDPAMPLRASADSDAPPLWVAASSAFGPDGSLQLDLFHPPFSQRLERHRAANVDGCVSYLTSPSLHLPATRTVEERVAASYTVVAGEIVEAEEGFFFGVPGRLFALKVSARPKIFGHSQTADRLYIFVAQADIATPRGHFCSTPPPGSVVPQLGDRVVAFAQLPGQDVFREFMVIDPRSGLIVQRRGALLGATALDSGAATDLEAVLTVIRRSRGLAEPPVR